jgi:uncharacterized membrane protein
MKLKFIKETNNAGDVFYYTTKDGLFVTNSLSHNIEKAKIIFDEIVKNKGIRESKEVIEHIEI